MVKDYIKKWKISATLRDKVVAYLNKDESRKGYYTITISGTGAMKSYKYGKCPWYKTLYREKISRAIIEEGITVVGQRAFEGCTSLEEVTIPSTVNRLVAFCFNDCKSLKKAKIPEGVAKIGTMTFGGCSALETVELPSTLESTGFAAFRDCVSLREIKLPRGLTELNSTTFYGCKSLCEIELPRSLETIGDWAFSYTNLKKVIIPDNVRTIGEYSFCFCKGLLEIVIPEYVEKIGDFTFDSCHQLTIRCEAKEKPSGYGENWNKDERPVVWGHGIIRNIKRIND